MDKDFKRAVAEADRYARKRNYPCLFPGCKETAIRGHGIQRALISEALAVNGVVYSLQQSFAQLLEMKSPYAPLKIVEIGINDASVFRGYCSQHDHALFAAAEIVKGKKPRGKYVALHLRAITFEYSRKRRTAIYYEKIGELHRSNHMRMDAKIQEIEYKDICKFMVKEYLERFYAVTPNPDLNNVEFFCLPFTRNLMVSCCGCFTSNKDGDPDSLIGYNLISYSDISVLVLTIFKTGEHHLNEFLTSYSDADGNERLVNDIAFSYSEEPLISPNVWLSLSATQKLEVRLSLRPPEFRTGEEIPRVIKLSPSDYFKSVTPKLYERLI